MDKEQKEDKVKKLVSEIIKKSETQGLTFTEMKMLPVELSKEINTIIKNYSNAALFKEAILYQDKPKKIWISKKKFKELEKRVNDIEERVQGQQERLKKLKLDRRAIYYNTKASLSAVREDRKDGKA